MTKEAIAVLLIRMCVEMELNCLNLLHHGIRKMETCVGQVTSAGRWKKTQEDRKKQDPDSTRKRITGPARPMALTIRTGSAHTHKHTSISPGYAVSNEKYV